MRKMTVSISGVVVVLSCGLVAASDRARLSSVAVTRGALGA